MALKNDKGLGISITLSLLAFFSLFSLSTQVNSNGDKIAGTHSIPAKVFWAEIYKEYQKQGVLCRILTNSIGRPVREKMSETLGGNAAPGTYLLPGAPIATFFPTKQGKAEAGVIYRANLPPQGLYKRNISSGHHYRPLGKVAPAYTYAGVKNHANYFSFAMKLEEMAIRHMVARKKGHRWYFSSGHYRNDGSITSRKQKSLRGYHERNEIPHNEAIVEWLSPNNNFLGVIISTRDFDVITSHAINNAIQIIRVLKLNGVPGERIPVVQYKAHQCQMTYLGSGESLEILSASGFIQGELILPKVCHDYVDFLCSHLNSYQSRIPSGEVPTPLAYMGYLSNKPQFSMHDITSPAYFADNIDRVCDALAVARGETLARNGDYLAVLGNIAQRQLLECYGAHFTDEEAIVLGITSVIVLWNKQFPFLNSWFGKVMGDSNVSPQLSKEIQSLLAGQSPQMIANNQKDCQRLKMYQFILNIFPQEEQAAPSETNSQEQALQIQQQYLRELIGCLSSTLPSFFECHGHRWPGMLRNLLFALKERIAIQINDCDLWPYSAMAILLPGDINILSVLLDSIAPLLIEHYSKTGAPVYLGTVVRNGTHPMTQKAVQREYSKIPHLVTGMYLIPVRSWEAIHDMFYDLAVLSKY